MTTATTRSLSTETAADHVATDVPIFPTQTTAGEARQVLTRRRYASRRDLAVSDEGRLVGLVTIENLLPADGGEMLAKLMDPDPPVVGPGVDQEVAA